MKKNFHFNFSKYAMIFSGQWLALILCLGQCALLTVQDAMGRELLRQPLPAARGQHELDVSTWPAGVYLLRLRQGEVEVVERFVKGE